LQTKVVEEIKKKTHCVCSNIFPLRKSCSLWGKVEK